MSEANDTHYDNESSSYWKPGVRLSTRVEAPRRAAVPASSRRPWWIAAVIIVGALIIAIALWLAALWAQNRSADDSTDLAGADVSLVVRPAPAA